MKSWILAHFNLSMTFRSRQIANAREPARSSFEYLRHPEAKLIPGHVRSMDLQSD